ncbi:metallophosphoesterase [Chroococcidiopsis sp. CCNUC1]|uniref:metallophosphoesterase family protein n=1 Tax=Chroococcidiopsis sp. CCNUC1 TaxID=2653189 RepID=UPI0020229415|nr:metallophosphoesterase [Chroococcidiopsis sp. CCNUC1]URD48551.1 metallophosphoesterase [Chroococcidiopsis sp. CCNUC1]
MRDNDANSKKLIHSHPTRFPIRLWRYGFGSQLWRTNSINGAGSIFTPKSATQPFRFVFLSDIHLRKDLRSPQGMAAALDAVERLSPKPAFIVTGGDLCHDLRSQGLKEANETANLFVKIWQEHTKLPTYHSLGNHDPAGWSSETFPQKHPQFGMKLLMDKLGMKSLSYSFNHNNWHFVVLDNIHLTAPGEFVGEFTEKQLAFLRQDLTQHAKQPTMIFCHVPPVTATEFLGGRAE